jgi:hypothetical protein
MTTLTKWLRQISLWKWPTHAGHPRRAFFSSFHEESFSNAKDNTAHHLLGALQKKI